MQLWYTFIFVPVLLTFRFLYSSDNLLYSYQCYYRFVFTALIPFYNHSSAATFNFSLQLWYLFIFIPVLLPSLFLCRSDTLFYSSKICYPSFFLKHWYPFIFIPVLLPFFFTALIIFLFIPVPLPFLLLCRPYTLLYSSSDDTVSFS
jgi:hypothetical protein